MSGKRRATYANIIIGVCVAVGLVVTLSVIWEYHRLNTPMPAGVVTAVLGMWTGELLIIALRQVFGSDVTRSRRPAEDKIDTSDIFGGSV